MNQAVITFEQMPSILSQILAKVEGLEKRLDAINVPQPQPDYVTLREAQEILRGTVTIGTIYNWKHQGRIDAIKVGRKLLFKRSDVEAILNNGLEKIEP